MARAGRPTDIPLRTTVTLEQPRNLTDDTVGENSVVFLVVSLKLVGELVGCCKLNAR